MEGLLEDEEEETVCKIMRQWVGAYRQLSQDLDRGVRGKSVEILNMLVVKLKREMAPFLKNVMGPWWMAQHDIHLPIAQTAQAAFDV